MITVLLQGRTGNNLFQYAAGRALADYLDTNLILDGSWADPELAKQFEEVFRFPLRATYRRRFSNPKRALQKYLSIKPWSLHQGLVYVETGAGYNIDLLKQPDDSYVAGFFQSPRYFASIEATLRAELDLTSIPLPQDSLNFEEELRSQNTISLHIRRGDYLNIPSTRCLVENYHELAIEYFRENFDAPRFCVFSDDISWCRSRFKGGDFMFCEFIGSALSPLHDMRLMAACHHHVIVNSSYSWWAAWLNPSNEKVVVAPSMWMTGLPSTCLLLPDWITI